MTEISKICSGCTSLLALKSKSEGKVKNSFDPWDLLLSKLLWATNSTSCWNIVEANWVSEEGSIQQWNMVHTVPLNFLKRHFYDIK